MSARSRCRLPIATLCIALLLVTMLEACTIPMASRRNWQRKSSFSSKRDVTYNEFVQNGGMIDEDEDDIAKLPQHIQKMRKRAEYDLHGSIGVRPPQEDEKSTDDQSKKTTINSHQDERMNMQ